MASQAYAQSTVPRGTGIELDRRGQTERFLRMFAKPLHSFCGPTRSRRRNRYPAPCHTARKRAPMYLRIRCRPTRVPRLAPTPLRASLPLVGRLLPDVESRPPDRDSETSRLVAASSTLTGASLLISTRAMPPRAMSGRADTTPAPSIRRTYGQRCATPSLTPCGPE
jgi:hypothetical protein